MKITLESNIESLSELYLQTLVLLYRPCEVFGKNDTSTSSLYVKTEMCDGRVKAYVRICDNGKECESFSSQGEYENYPDGINIAKTVVGRAFCDCAQKVYGIKSPFGIITGIRPAKLALSYLERGFSATEIRKIFADAYMMDTAKADVLTDIASRERALLHSLEPKSFSLYVSIPFCPTRCSYCSFVSYSTERLLSMIPDYLTRLMSDIKDIAKTAKELGLSLYSVYIGGGTPSILSASMTESLISCINQSFDMSKCREFTFEAGRPDTVTYDKLAVLKKSGVGRISINTQTANNDVLRVVGRNHTFEEYLEKLSMARDVGFESINTDLISGLPTESVDSFCDSLGKVISAGVENITVHSLTLKKSSELKTLGEYELLSQGRTVREMLDYAQSELRRNSYLPYYIYRQKNTVGNLENTGYSISGRECLYNILMMEEFHTVFSAGAGAVTKLVSPDRKTIDRLFEQKYPYEYLGKEGKGFDAEAVINFYNQHFN